jgi:hypothetical protein
MGLADLFAGNGGQRAYRKLETVENWRELLAAVPDETWPVTVKETGAVKQVRDRKYWRNLLIPALILLLPLLLFLVLFFFFM